MLSAVAPDNETISIDINILKDLFEYSNANDSKDILDRLIKLSSKEDSNPGESKLSKKLHHPFFSVPHVEIPRRSAWSGSWSVLGSGFGLGLGNVPHLPKPKDSATSSRDRNRILLSFGKADHGKLGHGNAQMHRLVPTLVESLLDIDIVKTSSMSTYSIAIDRYDIET